MTTPTQAQIEAAELAYRTARDLGKDRDDCWTAALAAAAQVGEPYRPANMKVADMMIRDLEEKVRTTIERCAQVVEEISASGNQIHNDKLIEVAAAIRKLKDQP